MLYLNKIKRADFLAVGHQICREFLIASIKHQKAWGSEDRVLQTAQQWEQFERYFIFDMTSKTECRGFKSYCPCHTKWLKHCVWATSYFLIIKNFMFQNQISEHQFWILVIFNYIFDDGAWSWDSNNHARNEHQFRIRLHPFASVPSATSSF